MQLYESDGETVRESVIQIKQFTIMLKENEKREIEEKILIKLFLYKRQYAQLNVPG